VSRYDFVAEALEYMLTRWRASTGFLNHGSMGLSNNAAERVLRSLALGRKSWLFAGSDRGGMRAAMMYSLSMTASCRARHEAVYAGRRTMPSGPTFSHLFRDLAASLAA
jgi:transposase